MQYIDLIVSTIVFLMAFILAIFYLPFALPINEDIQAVVAADDLFSTLTKNTTVYNVNFEDNYSEIHPFLINIDTENEFILFDNDEFVVRDENNIFGVCANNLWLYDRDVNRTKILIFEENFETNNYENNFTFSTSPEPERNYNVLKMDNGSWIEYDKSLSWYNAEISFNAQEIELFFNYVDSANHIQIIIAEDSAEVFVKKNNLTIEHDGFGISSDEWRTIDFRINEDNFYVAVNNETLDFENLYNLDGKIRVSSVEDGSLLNKVGVYKNADLMQSSNVIYGEHFEFEIDDDTIYTNYKKIATNINFFLGESLNINNTNAPFYFLKNSESETKAILFPSTSEFWIYRKENEISSISISNEFSSIGNIVAGLEIWVAVGEDGNASYSEDGINWNEIDIKFNNTNAKSVTYGNGIWVIVGDNGKASYSEDGTNWIALTAGETTGIKFGDEISAHTVAYGDGLFIVFGELGRMSYSYDGIDWTRVISSEITYNVRGLAYGNGRWIVVGDNGNASYSDDGIDWNSTNINFGTSTAYSVAYGNQKWLVVGAGGKASYSTNNGATWSTLTPGVGSGIKFGDEEPYSNAYSIKHNSNRWVVVGAGGKASYSNDGISWTSLAPGTDSGIKFGNTAGISDAYSVRYGNGVWVVVGNNSKISYSTNNAQEWTNTDINFNSSLAVNSVLYSNETNKIYLIDNTTENNILTLRFFNKETLAPTNCEYEINNEILKINSCNSDAIAKIKLHYTENAITIKEKEFPNYSYMKEEKKILFYKDLENINSFFDYDDSENHSTYIKISNNHINIEIGRKKPGSPIYKRYTNFITETGTKEIVEIILEIYRYTV